MGTRDELVKSLGSFLSSSWYLLGWKSSKTGKDFVKILLYILKEIRVDIDRNIFCVYGLEDLILKLLILPIVRYRFTDLGQCPSKSQ